MQVPSQIKGRADIWWKIKNGITKNNKIDNLTNLSYSLKKPTDISIAVTWHGVGGVSGDCDQMIGTIKWNDWKFILSILIFYLSGPLYLMCMCLMWQLVNPRSLMGSTESSCLALIRSWWNLAKCGKMQNWAGKVPGTRLRNDMPKKYKICHNLETRLK